MKKLLKLCIFLAATSILFVTIASLAFYHLIRVGEFRRFLVAQIEQQTQLKVELGDADLDLGWISGIAFRDVALSEPGSSRPLIAAERITARVALLPLLERKLVFYEVRLLRPKAQMTREKDGRIPLLDKLLNLPLLRRKDSEYQLDLRAIKVQQAQVEWIDRRPEGAPVSFRLRDVDADIERMQGQQLRAFVNDLLKGQKNYPRGPALQVALEGVLDKDGYQTAVRAKARVVSSEQAREFRDAWWNADVTLVNMPATLLLEYTGRGLALKSMSGHFAQQLHLQGRPSEGLRIHGDLEFRQLGLEAPELFAAPVKLGDGRAHFVADWSPQRIAFSQLSIRSNEVRLSLQGEVRSVRKDPYFQLTLSAAPMRVQTLRKWLPVKLIGASNVERLLASLQEGEFHLKKAGVNASLAEMRRWADSGIGEGLWLDAELRNVDVALNADGALPLRVLHGQLALAKEVITFTGVQAAYGNSWLKKMDATYAPGERRLELQARGDLDLSEARAQIRAGMFPAEAANLLASIEDLSGRARADITLRRIRDAPMQVGGKIGLTNVRLRKDDLVLTDLRGDLVFTGTEIKGEQIAASVFGSPIQVSLSLSDYNSRDGSFDVKIDSTGMKAGIVTRLLLSSGSVQDPGIVRGYIRYYGSLAKTDNRKFSGNLDLINVQLAIQPLLQPIRELNGRIRIDEKGVDFQNLRGSLVGFPSTVSGRWRYREKPQLVFDFAAPNLDITYLISQVDAESSELYANLQAQGRISLAKGKVKSFEFSDLRSALLIDQRVWRLTDLTARAAGGTVQALITVDDRPETLHMAADSKVQGVPVQSFLRWFDMTTTEMTGRVNVTGSLQTIGNNDPQRKRNLNGAFNLRIEEGTIKRMRVLVQILNLLDLSRWFSLQLPDLRKEGIRFRSITGDFNVDKGVYFTQNLLVDSDDLRMTGSGKIDVSKDEIDFLVAVRPFAGIDSAINRIPLLGRGIAAIKNSFLVASFNIRGRIDDPTITPAPLGTVSEWFWGVLGIPKSLIGLDDGNNTGNNKPAPK